jgi:oligopeptidase B
VAAQGGSAGGLLMGAIANMAPQDYDVIVAQVPFVDAVTTMLDPTIPLTTNEYDEWGNPSDRA